MQSQYVSPGRSRRHRSAIAGLRSVWGDTPRLAPRVRDSPGSHVSPALLVVAAFALLTLPGLLLGTALGLRSWILVGSAPALTVGAAGVLAAWVRLVGVRWPAATPAAGLLVLCGGGAACARPWRRGAARVAVGYRVHHH